MSTAQAVKLIAKRSKGVKEVSCVGAAHTNPYIDHCGMCLDHRWGWLTIPVECDSLDDYRDQLCIVRGCVWPDMPQPKF